MNRLPNAEQQGLLARFMGNTACDPEEGVFMQNIAEVIASVLKLDVTIVDKNLSRVAGTGYYFDKVNTLIPCGSSFDFVLSTGKKMVISNVGDGLCQGCSMRESCVELAHVCCPICIEEKPIGVLGLVAFDSEQRSRLLNALNDYEDFLDQICNLIAAKIRGDETIDELLAAHSQISIIMQTVNEGMMLVNDQGRVTYCNKASEILLETPAGLIVGRHIKEIFNDTEMDWSKPLQEDFEFREVTRVEQNHRISCFVTNKPVQVDHKYLGAVLTFYTASTVHRLVGEFSSDQIDHSFNTILGNSKAIVECKHQAALAAKSNSTVLITGETGTGKDLLARAIHSSSSRKEKAFIAINCAAIPETLLESELFGYEEGAFTGAKKGGKPGKFQLADEGTLFLDEIGDMPLFLQVKLLRVLQEGSVERVGGVNKIPLNVRIIAATNRNLGELTKHGEFREDLFYRINVIPIEIPPLRERSSDVRILIDHFLEHYGKLLEKPYLRFSPEALQLLCNHNWPGNVRELENIVEYAVNMATAGRITVENLPKKLQIDKDTEAVTPLAELEKKELQKALNYFGNTTESKKKISSALGISIASVYRKLKLHGLA